MTTTTATTTVALARLPEFTAQQLVLTLHAMAQLGYHPGARFLEAWASCLCERMRAPLPPCSGLSKARGGRRSHWAESGPATDMEGTEKEDYKKKKTLDRILI